MSIVAAGLADRSDARGTGDGHARAQAAASPGTLACTDRRRHLVLVRGDGRRRRKLALLGRNPIFSPDGNWIAYDATTPEPHDNLRKPKLFIADRSGRKLHRAVSLENSQYWEAAGFDAIAWSPDSRHVAYVRSEPDPEMQESRRGLFVTDIQTGERELPLHVEGTTPAADEQRRWGLYDPVAYSPDGRTLVVAGTHSDSPSPTSRGIWLVDAQSGAARLLLDLGFTPGASDVFSLAWSPDGNHIALLEGTRGFFVLDVHTGATTQGEKAVGDPPIRWSRDGSRIASTGGRGIWPDVRVTNANVSQTVDPTRGTPRNFAEEIPLWSPNGRLLAYNRRFVGGGSRETYRKAAAQSGVYVVSPSGGAPRKLIGSTPPSGKDLGTNEIFGPDGSPR